MEKKRIIFYTDCFIFGGCEKSFYEIISAKSFLKDFDYVLVYRAAREYEYGRRCAFPFIPEGKIKKVYFPDINTWYLRLEGAVTQSCFLKWSKRFLSLSFRIIQPFLLIWESLYLYLLFLKEDAEIVHINNGGYPGALSCRAAVIAARLAKKRKIILSVHNMSLKTKAIFERIVDFFVRKSVVRVITGSKAAGSALVTNRRFTGNKIITINHGIRDTSEAGQAVSPGPRNNFISMVARFEERKGHRFAVLAFRDLIRAHPEFADVKLFFIGNGPELPKIKEIVFQEKLEDKIIFSGFRDDRLRYVASSLFLINPSLGFEDLPYAVLEAMSLGIPAIGTAVGGIPEEIEDGVTGFIVRPKDVKALAEAMYVLLNDGQKRSDMGGLAKKRFQELFTLDRMIGNYLRVYANQA